MRDPRQWCERDETERQDDGSRKNFAHGTPLPSMRAPAASAGITGAIAVVIAKQITIRAMKRMFPSASLSACMLCERTRRRDHKCERRAKIMSRCNLYRDIRVIAPRYAEEFLRTAADIQTVRIPARADGMSRRNNRQNRCCGYEKSKGH